jgi:transposase-like protein
LVSRDLHSIFRFFELENPGPSQAFVRDLKQVYRAANKDLAEKRLGDLRERWGDKYPIVIKSWENNWERLSAFYKYPEEVRRVMYTTNTIEGFHRQMRKILKTKGAFPTKEAFLKISYLAIQNIQKKWERPIHNWNQILSTLCTLYGERVPLTIKG